MRHSARQGPGLAEETERRCPECGRAMIEFDRLMEDGAVFIWYACSGENCTGQWLAKKAFRMVGV
jgi:hypothetical protein